MPMDKENGPVTPPLVGTPDNPARDPKSSANAMKGTLGYTALTDSIVIVIAAWVLLILLWYSLRHHNI